MRLLLIGNGAREHAIASAACRSAGVELYAYMGARNPGIARLCKDCRVGSVTSAPEVLEYARKRSIDLVVVGPEAVLEAGVTDALIQAGIPCASPTREASRLEWDKAYARALGKKHKIKGCPRFGVFSDAREAAKYIDSLGGEVAVKPAGLTGGKGVKVAGYQLANADDAKKYAAEVLGSNIGKLNSVVIEEKLIGEEFTLQAFVDGKNVVGMPAVQDHKRAFEGDVGPNTGGMGSYSDKGFILPFITRRDYDDGLKIMEKTIRAFKKETGTEYKGFLYGQFMAGTEGLKLVEFNARLGDPEAMNVLALLRSDFGDILARIADGSLARADFEERATVCKYLVPAGYPENPQKNQPLKIDEKKIEEADAQIYYASVDEREGVIYSGSSRAIALLGIADTIDEAEKTAERATEFVSGPLFHRKDIGTRALVQKRIEHMRELREA